jgi:hypothetical protein
LAKKIFFLQIVVLAGIIFLILFLNKGYLEEHINTNEYSMSPTSFPEAMKKTLKENDYISLEGTINPYQIILQRGQTQSAYYVTLKEYANFFIIQIPETEFDYQKQNFSGRLKPLTKISGWNTIQTELNKPIGAEQILGQNFKYELNETDKEKINQTVNNPITEETFVLESREEVEFSEFLFKIFLWIMSIMILTYIIFTHRIKREARE